MAKLPNFSFVCEGNKGRADHRQLVLLVKDKRYSPRTNAPLVEDYSPEQLESDSLDYYTRAQNSTPGSYSERTFWLDETNHPLAKAETDLARQAAFYCPKCRRATQRQSQEKIFAIIQHQLDNGQISFNIGLLFES